MIRLLSLLLVTTIAHAAPMTDEQLRVDALQQISQKNFDAALADFTQMSSEYRAQRDIKSLEASAFAGRGGLDVPTLTENLRKHTTQNWFTFLLVNFDHGTAATISDLVQAENLMMSITEPKYLNQDELTELAYISMAKMGSVLSRYADPHGTGAVVYGFNPCDFKKFPGMPDVKAPDNDVRNFGASLNISHAALTELQSREIDIGVPATATGSPPICAWFSRVGLGRYNFCGVTDANELQGSMLVGIRSIINEGRAGIGLRACDGNISQCFCP